MTTFLRKRAIGLAGLAILGLAACGDDGSGPSNPSLTQAEAQFAAEVVSNDADGGLDGLTSSSADGIAFAVAGAPASGGASFAAAGMAPPFGAQCTPAPQVSPTPVANTDGDFVPDSIRVTFDPPCILSLPLRTITRTGIIDVIDPTPASEGFGRKLRFIDFATEVERLVSGATVSATWNGIRTVTGDADQLQYTADNFVTEFTHAGGSVTTHTRTWSATFTADVAGSIERHQALPSGLLNITGTSSWTRGDASWSASITTNPQLHYNASCTEAPRFDDGTLTLVVTRGGNTSTVTIEYTACGVYTVTRS
ncbi:MAG TPA: hypothetical protein VFU46_11565 [Gemmatimonadales bacterium]|nr:hypothetical protein [Gemmatimonadales bacterium]